MYIPIGAASPEKFGSMWIRAPEATGHTFYVAKNEKSYRAVCQLTGVTVLVLFNHKAGKEIAKFLQYGEILKLSNYVTRLVLDHSKISDLHTAIEGRLQKEYKRGRAELQEEIKEMLGL
jgi:hypothetical protein